MGKLKEKFGEHIIGLVFVVAANLITAALSAMSKWDAPIIFLAMLAATFLTLGILYVWDKLRYWRLKRPVNVNRWKHVEEMTIWQAACLFDDVEPYRQITDETPCYASLQMIKSAANNGKIEVIKQPSSVINMMAIVTADSLRQYAEYIGIKPKVFFS